MPGRGRSPTSPWALRKVHTYQHPTSQVSEVAKTETSQLKRRAVKSGAGMDHRSHLDAQVKCAADALTSACSRYGPGTSVLRMVLEVRTYVAPGRMLVALRPLMSELVVANGWSWTRMAPSPTGLVVRSLF